MGKGERESGHMGGEGYMVRGIRAVTMTVGIRWTWSGTLTVISKMV